MEEELKHFLKHWFAGYMDGLVSLDTEQQDVFLSSCGQACADSYTGELFRKAWKDAGGDIPRFLENLSVFFPEAEYVLVDKNKIQVNYTNCACGLVIRGFVDNPMQCLCSLYNLKVNFQQAMERDINVQLQKSILAGEDRCQFEVSWSMI